MPRKRKAQAEPEEPSPAPKTRASRAAPPPQSRSPFATYPPSKVYRLLEPGPVILVTTGSLRDGTHNVMTAGFHMVVQHSPPLLALSLGPWDASFAALKANHECVLAIPSAEMAATAVDVGNCSADEGSKWERFGLEALPAAKVQAPLVGGRDVIANVECVVEDASMVGKYSLWVLRAVKAWVNEERRPGEGGTMVHHRGDGTFVLDGEVLDLRERMVKWKQFQD